MRRTLYRLSYRSCWKIGATLIIYSLIKRQRRLDLENVWYMVRVPYIYIYVRKALFLVHKGDLPRTHAPILVWMLEIFF
jgi:hypothetical protein